MIEVDVENLLFMVIEVILKDLVMIVEGMN